MTARRLPPVAALVGGVLVDTFVATADPTTPPAPVVTFAAVVAVGLARGPRVGAAAGFVIGVVLDLLSGPGGLGGAATLACLASGAIAGVVAERTRPGRSGAAAAGAALVPCGVVSQSSVQGLAGWAPAVPWPLIAGAALVGMLVAPVVRQWSGDLTVRSVPFSSRRAYNPR